MDKKTLRLEIKKLRDLKKDNEPMSVVWDDHNIKINLSIIIKIKHTIKIAIYIILLFFIFNLLSH